MTRIKEYAKRKKGGDFKVIVLFDSVSDSLFNYESQQSQLKNKGEGQQERDYGASKADFDKFCIDLTISYEFDYIELFQETEVIDFLKEMHFSI